MKLSAQDANLFYELMWALQYYVKQKLQLLPSIKTLKQYANDASLEDKATVRQALYENPLLIDSFLQENSEDFSEEKLALIRQWKHFLAGDFYIERMLRKYTIFIGQNDTVYGVWGLQTDFDEMLYPSQLPLLVKAVLLPFRDVIIYDGLLKSYNISFGSGISGNLKEVYLRAKQRGEIIESLPAQSTQQATTSKSTKPLKDWSAELEELVAKASKLKGGGGQPAIYSPVFSLIKASLDLGQTAISQPDAEESLWKLVGKVEQALRKVERAIDRGS